MKTYRQTDNIGRAKYTVSFHDGEKTHPDGSPFFDIRIFKNKTSLAAFTKQLVAQEYQQT